MLNFLKCRPLNVVTADVNVLMNRVVPTHVFECCCRGLEHTKAIEILLRYSLEN